MFRKLLAHMGIVKKVQPESTAVELERRDIQFLLKLISDSQLTIPGKNIQHLFDVVYKLQMIDKNFE